MTTRKISFYFNRDVNNNTRNPATEPYHNNKMNTFTIPVDKPQEIVTQKESVNYKYSKLSKSLLNPKVNYDSQAKINNKPPIPFTTPKGGYFTQQDPPRVRRAHTSITIWLLKKSMNPAESTLPQHTDTPRHYQQISDTPPLLKSTEYSRITHTSTIPVKIVSGKYNKSNKPNCYPKANALPDENISSREDSTSLTNENTDNLIKQPMATTPNTNLLHITETSTNYQHSCLLLLPDGTAISTTHNLQHWKPAVELPFSRSSNVLDLDCDLPGMMNIKTICCLPTSATFVSHPTRPQEKITVKELRALVSQSSDINQQILNMFMTILKHQLGVSFLDSSFFTLLKDGGWNRVKRWLRTSEQVNQIHKLSLLDPAIIFPCHIHGCHWVAVTRRVIAGSVYFLYADDMNQPNTEKIIRQTLSTSSTDFYPKGTTWINCCNYTYLPHSN